MATQDHAVEYEQAYEDCDVCNGSGSVYRIRECRNSDGTYRSEENCTCCNGKGYTMVVRTMRHTGLQGHRGHR